MLFMLSAQMFPFGLAAGRALSRLCRPRADQHPARADACPTSSSRCRSRRTCSTATSARCPTKLIEAARAGWRVGPADLPYDRAAALGASRSSRCSCIPSCGRGTTLLYSMTLITSEQLRTVGPGLLLNYLNEVNSDWGGAMAASLLAALPVNRRVHAAAALLHRGCHRGSSKMTLSGCLPCPLHSIPSRWSHRRGGHG